MDWVIYVPESASRNLDIGLKNKTWGHKAIFKTVRTDEVEPDDTLYLVEHLRLMKNEDGTSVPGFPRVAAEYYNGVVASISKCKITSKMYHDDSIIWPDDTYPFRYSIELIERRHNVLFGQEFFTSEFVEAVQRSTLRKGLAIDLTNSHTSIYTSSEDTEFEAVEGKPIYKRHIVRERNKEIVRLKKLESKKKNGELSCEACGFNFEKFYGERGVDYIECHHTNPLSNTTGDQKTSLNDLSLLCSNCHRIIHRSKPWITIEELKGRING
ncbi:HNH endonuclease [Vibrio alginolyticus]|uniref:HNH endonuclease n=1 Tax=Vibrio alginolyticus TaxID=663 RepID=UPI00216050AA|nr:HNH endonuclease [Vibrio alginolyticus]MCS0187470.1 HNH endonuclease [Vibrio alginolyticus]